MFLTVFNNCSLTDGLSRDGMRMYPVSPDAQKYMRIIKALIPESTR